MTPSLRSPLQETPLFGILAAEAVRLLATYMFNYLTNADSPLTMKPFSPVTEPMSRVYTYSPTNDQLLCKSGDTKAALMPVQFGFPPEAETGGDQSAAVPAKSLLYMLTEKRASKKDDTDETLALKLNSPPHGSKQDDGLTPNKLEAPAAKKRSGSGRASGASTGPAVAKKAKDSRV